MATKIGINGFGRIGRNVFKLLIENPEFEVVSINDLTDAKTLATLLKYDSVFGVYNAEVSHTEYAIVVNGKEVKITAIKDPAQIGWGDKGVEMVLTLGTGVGSALFVEGRLVPNLEYGEKSLVTQYQFHRNYE